MKRLFLAFAVAMLVITSGSTAYASSIENSFSEDEGGGTCTVPSSFTVPDYFFSGYVLVIPADLNLAYNETKGAFICEDTFYAKGKVSASKKLIVGVEPEGTWSSSSYNDNVSGSLKLDGNSAKSISLSGVSRNLSYVECSAEELSKGLTANPVTHSILVSVPEDDISYKTTYSNNINFYVGLTNN